MTENNKNLKLKSDSIDKEVRELYKQAMNIPSPMSRMEDENSLPAISPYIGFNILSKNTIPIPKYDDNIGVYVRRNMLLNLWRERVEYLFSNLECSFINSLQSLNILEDRHYRFGLSYNPLVNGTLCDFNKFVMIANDDTIKDMAFQLGMSVFNTINRIVIGRPEVTTQEDYADISFEVTNLVNQLIFNIHNILKLLLEEFYEYYIQLDNPNGDYTICYDQGNDGVALNLKYPINKQPKKSSGCDNCDW